MKGIRRVLAPNPGMMTGPGTNTYLVGEREIAVIDPGPAIASHLDAIQAQAGAPITQIWLTHAHPDHATAVPALREATGAVLMAWPTPNPTYAIPSLPTPDRALADGDDITLDGEHYQALHCPGHASDHLCFFRPADGALFTGDVVVGLGTVVIAPPDGDLTQYLASLARLLTLHATVILPGHGEPITHPDAKLREYIDHRLAREVQVLGGLERGLTTVAALVADIYAAVDPRVHPVAAQQVLGHLFKLVREGKVARDGDMWRQVP
ncbi:MAG: fold metallo-hydrolase [Cyanobacteria bacterium RYN_339]|nr:fold metallo-hydrolase [Cyanobacteria bacterium RYN_339]